MSTNDVGWDDRASTTYRVSVATNQSARCDLPNSEVIILRNVLKTTRHSRTSIGLIEISPIVQTSVQEPSYRNWVLSISSG